MNVVIVRLGVGVTGSRTWLRDGQTLTVGSSHRADLCVDDDTQLAEVHFRVEVKAGVCRVKSLAEGQGRLLVNGSPVEEAVLKDQDTIHAGRSRFRVSIDGPRSSASSSAGETQGDDPAERTLRVSQQATATGFQALHAPETRPHLPLVVATLGQGKRVFLLANFQRAQLPLPAGVAAEEDLFQHAPPDIRATESLHLIPVDETAAATELLINLAGKDAGLLVLADKSRDELAASHKLYWAWFAGPSLLTFQLSQGSAELAGNLFQDIYAVVIASPADEELVIYCHAEDAAAIQVALSALVVPESLPGD